MSESPSVRGSPSPGEARFPKDRRLRKRADFLRAQEAGLRATTPHFVLLVSRSPASPSSDDPSSATGRARAFARLGIVVTRKVGNAVERNRVKRVCRACFRTWPDFLPMGIDLVVIARAGAPTLGLAEVRAEWLSARPLLLKRAARALEAPARPDAAKGPPT